MHHIVPFNVQCYAIVMLITLYHCSLGAETGPKRTRYLIPFLRTGRSTVDEFDNNELLENILSPINYENGATFNSIVPNFLTFSQWLDNRFRTVRKDPQPPYSSLLYGLEGSNYYSKREDYTPRLGRNLKGI